MQIFFRSLLFLFVLTTAVHAEEVLLDQQAFIQQAFADVEGTAEAQVLWITKELKQTILEKIDYRLYGLRLRYWINGKRTAWVLEEIGKEQLITMGIVIEDDSVKSVKILVYRESRGGEVRHDFFTEQFPGAQLVDEKSRLSLSKSIDGITGATLSVRAVKKVATLALFLHRQVIPLGNKT